MSTISRFEEIQSWQLARVLNKNLGLLIDSSRFKHNYRLIAQMEGSAGSIMDNVAEGFERGGNREFIQFLYIARGSCGELGSQLYRALDRGYISQDEFDHYSLESAKISNLIFKLIQYLESTDLPGLRKKGRSEQH